MASGAVTLEIADHVCTMILNNPKKRNALSPEMLVQMHSILEDMRQKDEVRCIVLRGHGDKAFSAGYDISALPTREDPGLEKRLKEQSPLELTIDSIINYPYPVIAMLNGVAFGGGCELAISCDIRIGAEDIRMGMPPARLGVVYSPRGLLRFIQTLGYSRTKEIFLTGRTYSGVRLKELGLVDYLVPRKELEGFTYEFALEISNNAPISLKGTKRIITMWMSTLSLSEKDQQEAQRWIELAFQSEDLREGQRAFLERRRPLFKGR